MRPFAPAMLPYRPSTIIPVIFCSKFIQLLNEYSEDTQRQAYQSASATIEMFAVGFAWLRPPHTRDAVRCALNRPHLARHAERAFERSAVPFAEIGGRCVGALQKLHQRRIGIRCRAHRLI